MSCFDDDPLRYEYPDFDYDDHDPDEFDDNPDPDAFTVDPIINPAGIQIRKIESCFRHNMPEFNLKSSESSRLYSSGRNLVPL